MRHASILAAVLAFAAVVGLAPRAWSDQQELCATACRAYRAEEDRAEDYCSRLCFACYTEADDMACDRAREFMRKYEAQEKKEVEQEGERQPAEQQASEPAE